MGTFNFFFLGLGEEYSEFPLDLVVFKLGFGSVTVFCSVSSLEGVWLSGMKIVLEHVGQFVWLPIRLGNALIF